MSFLAFLSPSVVLATCLVIVLSLVGLIGLLLSESDRER